MRSLGWRACILPALFWSPQHGKWVSNKQTRSKGSAGSWFAALRHGLALPHGAGHRSIELCTGRVLAFHHSGSVPGGSTDSLSVHAHRSRSHPG